MQAFTEHTGIVMPLDRANVDTDAIIPAQYLTSVARTGFAEGLFSHWRYANETTKEPNPSFELNMPRYQGASVLVTRENFGCGSSREHAPWALAEYGFCAIIAPSFADIFYNNCLNIGILPITLDAETVQSLFEEVNTTEGYTLHIDLGEQAVTTPEGRVLRFEIDSYRKEALLLGLDAVGRTLHMQDKIAAYERQRAQVTPWQFA
ncbi:3-isopropylmalate dehydratase small subunit [Ktedonobacter sp. SOSP1-52]|uniref:3-isopropylmalate dehydratase small subunit n=1 Tax=Ktedonobacter sp. SOSP1-52 TaxID=2778366 RepID=UPI001915C0AC|nr:3-isopropylmalate dehydratase small subunit [Ktedonobacter sp. SOSP1-52]GHO70010.1 3-isopropylmalate dehydratase small subunit [Ktedonobacter sp. SOSP1-52]